MSAPSHPLTRSLQTPPVITVGQPPKSTPPILKKNFKKHTSMHTKDETGSERSVTVGILVKNKPSKHSVLSSQPMSHSSFSQKDDVSNKGQVTSVGDNTLFADVISLATDPRHLSSLTAPAVNISLQSQGEIQADLSVFNDLSTKTQVDKEKTTHTLPNDPTVAAAFYAIIKGEKYSVVADATKRMLIYFMLISRGRKRANECKNQCCSYDISLILGNHIISKIAVAAKVTDTGKSYHDKTYIYPVSESQLAILFNICATSA